MKIMPDVFGIFLLLMLYFYFGIQYFYDPEGRIKISEVEFVGVFDPASVVGNSRFGRVTMVFVDENGEFIRDDGAAGQIGYARRNLKSGDMATIYWFDSCFDFFVDYFGCRTILAINDYNIEIGIEKYKEIKSSNLVFKRIIIFSFIIIIAYGIYYKKRNFK